MRMAIAIAGLVLLAGCGGGADDKAEKKPTLPKTYTAAQLQAALPVLKDIEDGKEQTSKCPGDDDCFTPKDGENWARHFLLQSPLAAAEADRAADEGSTDFVYLDVYRNTSVAAATKASAEARSVRTEYDGPFDTKAKKGKKEGELSYGEKGEGALEDTTVSGWNGYVSSRDFALTDLDGKENLRIREVELRVTQGNAAVSIVSGSVRGKRSIEECEKDARKVLEDYLTRLG